MSKLNYKDVTFDSFVLWSGPGATVEEFTENDNSVVDFSIVELGSSYICPACVERYDFYKEVYMKKEELEEYKAEDHYDYGFACCVDGCNNFDAVEIGFDLDECEIIE